MYKLTETICHDLPDWLEDLLEDLGDFSGDLEPNGLAAGAGAGLDKAISIISHSIPMPSSKCCNFILSSVNPIFYTEPVQVPDL